VFGIKLKNNSILPSLSRKRCPNDGREHIFILSLVAKTVNYFLFPEGKGVRRTDEEV
jgi:hypothetical protein